MKNLLPKVTNMLFVAVVGLIALSLALPGATFAATTPSLGAAATYGVLATTFNHNVATTTITGDLGYTGSFGTGPVVVTGSTNANYSQAGTDQGVALSTGLNTQACTPALTFGIDTVLSDLAQPLAPGVYCVTGDMSIGTGGITLGTTGTYIFRSTGALNTVANSVVTLSPGVSACDVFWTPGAATTLGANSTFVGTDIDDAGITVGNNVNWLGRALSFASTITVDSDDITVPDCTIATPSAPGRGTGRINVVKTVINDNGGTKTANDFPLFVNNTLVGTGLTNTYNTFGYGDVFMVSETKDSKYTATFSGDCDSTGKIVLKANDNAFCIITNNDIGAPVVTPPIPPSIDVVKVPSPLALPAGPGGVTYSYTLRNMGTVPVNNLTMIGDTCSPIVLKSGDLNSNGILEVNETWVYNCSTTLAATHTNTVVTTGWANGLMATDIASATVIVGAPIVPPLIHVTKVPSPLILLAKGGVVTYTEKITNPGTEPLSNVRLLDDKCAPLKFISGDVNVNGLLESTETWTYTCTTTLSQTTINTATATGEANGFAVKDVAIATVTVAAAVPMLPSTGFTPAVSNMFLAIVVIAGMGLIGAVLLVLRKKRAL